MSDETTIRNASEDAWIDSVTKHTEDLVHGLVWQRVGPWTWRLDPTPEDAEDDGEVSDQTFTLRVLSSGEFLCESERMYVLARYGACRSLGQRPEGLGATNLPLVIAGGMRGFRQIVECPTVKRRRRSEAFIEGINARIASIRAAFPPHAPHAMVAITTLENAIGEVSPGAYPQFPGEGYAEEMDYLRVILPTIENLSMVCEGETPVARRRAAETFAANVGMSLAEEVIVAFALWQSLYDQVRCKRDGGPVRPRHERARQYQNRVRAEKGRQVAEWTVLKPIERGWQIGPDGRHDSGRMVIEEVGLGCLLIHGDWSATALVSIGSKTAREGVHTLSKMDVETFATRVQRAESEPNTERVPEVALQAIYDLKLHLLGKDPFETSPNLGVRPPFPGKLDRETTARWKVLTRAEESLECEYVEAVALKLYDDLGDDLMDSESVCDFGVVVSERVLFAHAVLGQLDALLSVGEMTRDAEWAAPQ